MQYYARIILIGDINMAKRNTDSAISNNDKGKIRVLFAEVEGNNQSLQDLMKTMVAAMNRPSQALLPPSRRGNDDTATGDNASAEREFLNLETPTGEELDEDSAPDSQVAVASDRSKRGTGVKRDYNAGIQIVPDLDFVSAGSTPLKTFFSAKAPSKDGDQVLVVTYYLQNEMRQNPIGLGHIFTALKHVGKPIPLDLPSTVRNLKKKAWLNFTKLDDIKVATEGQNRVIHNLGGNGTG